MKRLYMYMLLFLWGSGVCFPVMWYLYRGGFAKVYGTPDKYLWLSAKLVTWVVFISIFLIIILPDFKKGISNLTIGSKLSRNTNSNVLVFYMLLGIRLIDNLWNAYQSGLTVFQWMIQGGNQGRLMGYVGIFTDLSVLMAMYLLAYKKHIKVIPFVITYVFYTVVCGSRSGMMWILVILIGMLLCVENEPFKISLKQYLPYILIGILLMPVLYVVASSLRGYENYGFEYMVNQIVARISILEDSGVALRKADCGEWNAGLFYEKYSFVNQLKCIVNSMVPGSIFEQDIWPNLYYRAIFLGESVEQCRAMYCSNYLILPVYLLLKYQVVLAVVLSVVLLVGLYILLEIFEKYAISRICAVYLLWEVFCFFDWGFVADRFRGIICTFVFVYVIAYPIFKTRFKFPHIPSFYINHRCKIRKKRNFIFYIGKDN